MEKTNNSDIIEKSLYDDVCEIIDDTRHKVAVFVNAEACWLNWNVGVRIKEDVLYNQRAEYGEKVLKNLSKKLLKRYGSGWGYGKLQHCVRSAYTFSKEEIEYAVRTQLSWTHLRSLMSVPNDLARQFYMEMCRLEHWTTRMLDEKIDSQLFERTAISRRPDEIIKSELTKGKEQNELRPDMVCQSTCFLDMLGLPDIFSESDLEIRSI